MLSRIFAALLLAGSLAAAPAFAQMRLSQIKARGYLTCAAFERPSLARATPRGWRGFYPEICRAIAIAALGPDAIFEFKTLDLPRDSQALDAGVFDVLFLTEEEIAKHALAGEVAPGPAVFFNSYALIVEKGSPAKRPEDLAGAPICLHEADPAAEALEEFFARKGKSFIAMPFQEDIEWLDAYNARHCRAAASETTDLIDLRLRRGVNRFESVILPEKLAVFPILAATPKGNSRWSAAVSWVVHFLHAAERRPTRWRPGGAQAIDLDATALGLEKSWRSDILAKVGDYGAIYDRSLGKESPYKLSRGVNAPWSEGGLFAPPMAE
jgi:general L-amino acid transport system substrate-binding protein